MIDAGNILAEQKPGHEIIRRMLGTGLVRGQIIVFQQAFIDRARAPGLVQEKANTDAAGEQPEEGLAPQWKLEERVQPGYSPGAVPPFGVLGAASETGGTDQRRAAKCKRRLGHRAGEKLRRKRHGEG